MKTFKELFGTDKPIIALLHMRELPGDPGYPEGRSIEDVVRKAREELIALQDGGVDAILFSNEFSYPYLDELDAVTPASMAYVIGRLKDDIRIPFGVHAISDPLATLGLAAAVQAQFVRGVFAGGFVGEGGIRSKDAQSTAMKRSNLFWRFSLRTGIRSSTPSRKPGFPSAFRSAVAYASCPSFLKRRASAIIEPSESPSGLKCPETRIRLAPATIFFAAA